MDVLKRSISVSASTLLNRAIALPTVDLLKRAVTR